MTEVSEGDLHDLHRPGAYKVLSRGTHLQTEWGGWLCVDHSDDPWLHVVRVLDPNYRPISIWHKAPDGTWTQEL